MSKNTIDERVVSVKFDNKEFERNVRESMQTIDQMQQKMNFDEAAKSMDNAFDTAESGFAMFSKSTTKVKKSFTAMEVVAFTTINRITNKIEDMAERLVKSLSVDQLTSGWTKFEESTKSIGTLVSQGNTISTVTEGMKKLMWYTDATSYSYTDMADNIGKFTAAGQDLDDSIDAMIGIANWAATAGQNASTASRAMYQLSQAIAAGSVRYQDYKSIQNANMDTTEFRKQALAAAKAAGYLQKTIQGTYITTSKAAKAGIEVTESNFANTLTEGGWFTSDVLMNTLKNYSSVVTEIYESSDSYSTTEEAIAAFEKTLAETPDTIKEFGLKSFKAAQEARTFTDAINATKDAVSSGWLNTFSNIFGDYEEQKKTWSQFANDFWEIFAYGGTVRNKVLSAWAELGGRDALFGIEGEVRTITDEEGNNLDIVNQEAGALWNLLDIIKEIKNAISGAFAIVAGFDPDGDVGDFANNMLTLTQRFREWTKNLKESVIEALPSFQSGLVGVIKIIKSMFSLLGKAISLAQKILHAVWPIVDALLYIAGDIINKIANGIGKITNKISANKSFDGLYTIATAISTAMIKGYEKVSQILDKLFNKVGNLVNRFMEWAKSTGYLEKLRQSLARLFTLLGNAFVKLGKNLTSVGKKANDSKTAKTIRSAIKEFFIDLPNKIDTLVNKLQKFGNKIKDLANITKSSLKNISNPFDKLKASINDKKSLLSATLMSSDGETEQTVTTDIDGMITQIESSEKQLSTIERFKQYLVNLKARFKKSLVYEFLVSLKELIKSCGRLIASMLPLITSIIKGITKIINWTTKFITNIKTYIQKLKKIDKEYVVALGILVGIVAILYKIITIVWVIKMTTKELMLSASYLMDKAAGYMKAKTIEAYSNVISMFATAILKIGLLAAVLGGLDESTLKKGITSVIIIMGMLTACLAVIGKFMKSTYKSSRVFDENAKGIIGKFTGKQVDSEGSTFGQVAGIIRSISLFILALSISLKMISKLSVESLTKSLATIAATLVVLAIFMRSMKGTEGVNKQHVKTIKKLVGLVGTVATAIGTLSLRGNPKSLEAAAKALTIVLIALSGIMIGYSIYAKATKNVKTKDGVSRLKYMPALMKLVALTTGSLLLLSRIQPKRLKTVTGVVVAMMMTFTGVISAMSFLTKKVKKKENYGSIFDKDKLESLMIALELMMVNMAGLAVIAALVDPYRLTATSAIAIATMMSFTGILTVLSLISNKVKKEKNYGSIFDKDKMKSLMIALELMMVNMAGLAVIAAFVDPKNLAATAGITVATLGALVGIMAGIAMVSNMNIDFTKFKAITNALQFIVLDMILITGSIIILASYPRSMIEQGLISMAAIVGLLITAVGSLMVLSKISTGSLSGASLAALAVLLIGLTGSLILVADAMQSLANVKWSDLGKAGAIIGGLIVSMIALAVIGKLAGPALAGLAVSIIALTSAILSILLAINLLQNIDAEKLMEGIHNLATALTDDNGDLEIIMEKLGNMLAVLLTSSITGFIKKLDSIIQMIRPYIYRIINTLIAILVDSTPVIVDALCKILIAIIDGLTENISEIISSIQRFIFALFEALIDASGKALIWLGETLWSLLKKLWNGYCSYIKFVFIKLPKEFVEFGKNIIKGLVNGIKGAYHEVKETIEEVANNIKRKFKKIFGINSPSRVFTEYGDYMMQGLGNGLTDNIGIVSNSLDTVKDNVDEDMTSLAASISDTLANDIDNDLTIRPVMDLTDIEKGTADIQSMMQSTSGYELAGSVKYANSAAASANQSRAAQQVTTTATSAGTTENYQYTNTFNISGSNAKDIADEVNRTLQKQIKRSNAKWA